MKIDFREYVNNGVDNPDESGIIKTDKQKILQSKIEDGSVTLKINPIMQKKHMEATQEDGRSYFTISMSELQEIINKQHGTGQVYIKNVGQIKEIIEHDSDIGYDVDYYTGEKTMTNKFTIHYSKSRTHAVPTFKG